VPLTWEAGAVRTGDSSAGASTLKRVTSSPKSAAGAGQRQRQRQGDWGRADTMFCKGRC
jgi:hypothetical protein